MSTTAIQGPPPGKDPHEETVHDLWERWQREQNEHKYDDFALRMKYLQAANLVQVINSALEHPLPASMRQVGEETRDYLIHVFREKGLTATAEIAEMGKLAASQRHMIKA